MKQEREKIPKGYFNYQTGCWSKHTTLVRPVNYIRNQVDTKVDSMAVRFREELNAVRTLFIQVIADHQVGQRIYLLNNKGLVKLVLLDGQFGCNKSFESC